jgi:hypothetical protein
MLHLKCAALHSPKLPGGERGGVRAFAPCAPRVPMVQVARPPCTCWSPAGSGRTGKAAPQWDYLASSRTGALHGKGQMLLVHTWCPASADVPSCAAAMPAAVYVLDASRQRPPRATQRGSNDAHGRHQSSKATVPAVAPASARPRAWDGSDGDGPATTAAAAAAAASAAVSPPPPPSKLLRLLPSLLARAASTAGRRLVAWSQTALRPNSIRFFHTTRPTKYRPSTCDGAAALHFVLQGMQVADLPMLSTFVLDDQRI